MCTVNCIGSSLFSYTIKIKYYSSDLGNAYYYLLKFMIEYIDWIIINLLSFILIMSYKYIRRHKVVNHTAVLDMIMVLWFSSWFLCHIDYVNHTSYLLNKLIFCRVSVLVTIAVENFQTYYWKRMYSFSRRASLKRKQVSCLFWNRNSTSSASVVFARSLKLSSKIPNNSN